ncbi:MAG: serine/threonine-protein kinase [Planctomycetota bacterium]
MVVDVGKETRISEWRPEPFVGRTVDGYRVEELIGIGGMGAVFRATQLSLSRLVAIKVLSQALVGDPQFRGRFHREADVLSRLSHPNVVTVIDRGEVDGRPCLVMEYVEGANLRKVMDAGPMSAPEALRIVSSILDALEHAHEQGVVHRDIKPENVLLARGKIVKVADFGLSRLLGPAGSARLTRSHVVLGTYEYMAPEQREQVKEADERADLYATGVILYEMLTGELPIGRFQRPSQRRPDACDHRIDGIIDRSLEKDPGRRYQQASEMARAVSVLLDRPAPEAPLPEPSPIESALTELPSEYRPQRLENHVHNVAVMTTALGVLTCIAAAILTVVFLLDRQEFTGSVWTPGLILGLFSVMALIGVGVMMVGRGLRRFRTYAPTCVAIVSVPAALSGILLVFAAYAIWVLFGHRGRAYYDARSRGLDPVAAAGDAYRTLDASVPVSAATAGPATPAPVEEKAFSGQVRAGYIWYVVGAMVFGILMVQPGEISETPAIWGVIWVGITVLLLGLGLSTCISNARVRGVGAGIAGLGLAALTAFGLVLFL